MDTQVIDTAIRKNFKTIQKNFTALENPNKDYNFSLTHVKTIRAKVKKNKIELRKMKTSFESLSEDEAERQKTNYKKHMKNLDKFEVKLQEAEEELESLKTKDAAAVIAHADEVQDDTLAALANTKDVLDETDDIANTVAANLERQTEQIRNMQDVLYEIDDQTERAKKITSRMVIKMASNKTLMILIAVLVVGVIVDILIRKYYK